MVYGSLPSIGRMLKLRLNYNQVSDKLLVWT